MPTKNKAEAQRQEREDARARRRQAPALVRAAPRREENPVLLIVCQGEVTEVEYFKHFELATATVKAVGRAFDPEKLVQEAIDLRDAISRSRYPYEQVWCVFDKDDSTPQQVHAAMQRAAAEGIEIAFSNQCFEFWLLLHFDNHQGGGMRREVCGPRVEQLIKAASPRVSYNSQKGKHISRELFELLEADDPSAHPGRLPRRKVAIGRARAIDEYWQAQGTEPAYQESTTWVYKLVLILQKHLPA